MVWCDTALNFDVILETTNTKTLMYNHITTLCNYIIALGFLPSDIMPVPIIVLIIVDPLKLYSSAQFWSLSAKLATPPPPKNV